MRTKREIEEIFGQAGPTKLAESYVLVGILGAGMSGLAELLLTKGTLVKGTDAMDSPLADRLRALGADVRIGHSGDVVAAGDTVVLTDAIDLLTSPEFVAAQRLGCPVIRRSQLLAQLLVGKKMLAVTGTHGKTTTTGMAASGMLRAGMSPTVVVGADVPQFGGAIVQGSGEWAVVEACEAYDALRDLQPDIVLLTNLEVDHVDFHKDWHGLKQAVTSFVNRIPPEGCLVYNMEDTGAAEIADTFAGKKIAYTADFPGPMVLAGRHNNSNASGALAAIVAAGADQELGKQGISEFRGAERRLQVLREDEALVLIDDYAHHPTEVAASIEAVRSKWPGRRLLVVFQPHLYSRTEPLVAEFADALSKADLVVMTDIYPAREAPIPGVSSLLIEERISCPSAYVPQRRLLPRFVAGMLRPGDVVVGMGAGNISEFAPNLMQEVDRAGKRVAVVYGGDSAEREVSLVSGRAVHQALLESGFDSFLIDVSDQLLAGQSLAELSGPRRPDACFLAVHGTNAEDGAIQGLLRLLHLPFTGSGLASSVIAMDKARTKAILADAGLPVPRGLVCSPGDDAPVREAEGWAPPNGWVVKPNQQGSTVGLSFVHHPDGLAPAVARALQFDSQALIEEWLTGVEISVPILVDRALPAVEIVPASGRYDFASKYLAGATEEICPARISDDFAKRASEYALRAHTALGCAGCTRTDMIVTETGPVVLEVNTVPGMTPTSLVPKSAGVAGISFQELCRTIVEAAIGTKAT